MRSPLFLATAAFLIACRSSSSDGLSTGAGAQSTGDDASSSASLQNLAIAPLTLVPAFSPDIHDYYVRCTAGSNPLTVTVTAAEGETAARLQPTASAAAATQSTDVVVTEDQAIVATATQGTATTEYWVRCLPHTFPQLAMTPHTSAGAVTPGYYLIGAIFSATGEAGYAMVLDTNGTPVWYGLTVNGASAQDVEVLSTNTISYAPLGGYTFGTSMGQFELHALDPLGASFVQPAGVPLDTHELRLLANGDYLLFASPVTTGVDLTGLGTYGAGENILNGVIQEVTPAGQVVWQWTATDHFDPVKDTTWVQTASATNLAGQTVTVVDPFHLNSIDLDPNGNLLVSSRHMDSIFLVSKTTGQVLGKMGGSSYTKEGAPFIQVTGDAMGGFHRQHDARFQPDGTISIFDDETELAGPARAIVLSYDLTTSAAQVIWQYQGAASVDAMGSFTILPDGSRVIGWGTQAGNPTFSEVTTNGADMLDFTFSDGDESYRARKVATSALDLETLRRAVTSASSPATVQAQMDAGDDDAGDASDGGGSSPVVGCSIVSGASANAQCTYTATAAAGFSCASVAGSTAGSCPSPGIYGCCVETLPADGGGQTLSATCYYSGATGQPASEQCDLQAYLGQPYDWQTYAP
jgi:hypothetical protein